MKVRLSKSALEKFKTCPLCFWHEKRNGLKQPEGIHAGVPKGIERVVTEHYEQHRIAKMCPPELAGSIQGLLYVGDRISLRDLRNWRKGLTAIVDGVELSTALDDLLFDPDTKLYSMIDVKTKAKLPTTVEDTKKYYGLQVDCYDLALNANDYRTTGLGFFAYYAPKKVTICGGAVAGMDWDCQVVKLQADQANAKKLLLAAAACLDSAIPDPGAECEVCNYLVKREALLKVLNQQSQHQAAA